MDTDTADTDPNLQLPKKAKPRRREKLLDRDDWKTIAVIWFGSFLIAFFGSFFGILMAEWASHI